MVTENIDIVVRERGARVVRRQLESIGDSARASVRNLRLLQYSLYYIGGAGLVAALTRLVDTVSNFENRLRLLTTSSAELEAVQRELFAVANRTRTDFESTAEVFTRTALAVRTLGLSQRDTLKFTETLNQATILSGANAREANNALIQLSQGLAAGRLNGDELRSVLEQLPFVADIIAKQLGITRGQLRKFGADGKITSKVIIDAFKNAREEIAEKFAQTVPTIGQSLSVLRNNFLQIIDKVDDFTGGSALLARGIIALAESFQALVAGVVAATAAFVGLQVGKMINGMLAAVAANREFARAVASGNAILLTSVEIENAKAAAALRNAELNAVVAASEVGMAEAMLASQAAKIRDIKLTQTQLSQTIGLIQQQRAQALSYLELQRGIAIATGRTAQLVAAQNAYNASTKALIVSQRALRASQADLTAAQTAQAGVQATLTRATAAQTAANNALTASQGRAAAAAAAASTWSARLARAFPTITLALGSVAAGFGAVAAFAAANPFGVILAVVLALSAGIAFMADKIKITNDGVVHLGDVMTAALQLTMEALQPVTDWLGSKLAPAIDFVSKKWDDFKMVVGIAMGVTLQVIKDAVNLTIGLWVGAFNSVKRAWDLLPSAFRDIGALAINGLITIVEVGINKMIEQVDKLLSYIGKGFEALGQENPFTGLLDSMKVDLSRFRPELTGAAQEVGKIFSEEFSSALSADYVGDAWSAVLERARKIAEQRLVDLDKTGKATATPDGDSKKGKTFADYVRDLTLENEVLRENITLSKENAKIAEIQRALKRALTEQEKLLITELVKENEALKKMQSIFQEIKGPVYDYELSLKALNELLKQGKINQDEYNRSLMDARISFLETQTDFQSGFELGFLKIVQQASDSATQIANLMTSSFDQISSSIADLVVDGKADFESLFKTIAKGLIQLSLNQAFSAIFGNLSGGLNTGGVGNPINLLANPLKMATGGSFVVGGQPGVDKNFVPLALTRGERVDVTPAGKSRSGSGVNFAPVITIDARGSAPGTEEKIRQVVGRTLEDFSRFTLPERVREISKDPLARG